MYVLLYIDVNNMLVFLMFLLWKTEFCVSAIVDVKSQINKMAHDHLWKIVLLILLTRRRAKWKRAQVSHFLPI